MSDSLWPHGLQPARLLCPWNSPGKNTGVGSCSFLRGIFPTQELKPGLLYCRWFFTIWATRQATKTWQPNSVLGSYSVACSPVAILWSALSHCHGDKRTIFRLFDLCPQPAFSVYDLPSLFRKRTEVVGWSVPQLPQTETRMWQYFQNCSWTIVKFFLSHANPVFFFFHFLSFKL